ncbi:EcKinase, DUF1679, and/or APH domain containing protein [Asbolus verrucosus]|uniref:EcKinase, DUF1679, and/or APH domain containing protein n=1 Tax=Asbolus verrucosus TaxID=1661398 RepID=A0A482W0I2_ASBVE|nr:EcKinase, DUF1679, and/or APH domain containing protein [Asbolus verrucosus]
MEETLQGPTISEESVLKILKKRLKTDKFAVLNFTLNSMGEWIGLCGDHAILQVIVNDDEEPKISEKPLTFFVKLYPRLDYVIYFIEGTGSFRKEIFIYKLFDKFCDEKIKTLNDCVPKCYLTETNKFLVMENLVEQGYVSLNKHEFFDYDTIKVVLEALAKLHASSLVYEEKISNKLNKSYRLINEFEGEFEETYFNDREDFPNKQGLQASIKGILNSIEIFDLPQKLLSGKDFRTVLEEVLQKIFHLAKPSQKFRNVACHGDLWATNVLVKFDNNHKPINCKLVDFQCGRYTPPAQDVMSVIYLTTSREFRHKFMYNLIGIYYTSLEKHVTLAGFDMKKIITFTDFLASCEEQKVFGMLHAAMYFPLILLKTDVVKEYFGNIETNKKALEEDRSLLVKENIDMDENYKTRVLESLLDLKDYCDYLF